MLSPTGKVILGMIREGRRTGYEIKQLVDVSTRFFWAASYGQIYPELRRLEEQGLIVGGESSTDGRQRRAYDLTEAGEHALEHWLRSDEPLLFEMRDEGLLKTFFSDAVPVEDRLDNVRAMRARHEEVVTSLRSIESGARERGGGPSAVLRFGLALHGFYASWFEDLERELEAELERSQP
jgi:PadR family transcriptional regulator, regulatory protein AphA